MNKSNVKKIALLLLRFAHSQLNFQKYPSRDLSHVGVYIPRDLSHGRYIDTSHVS